MVLVNFDTGEPLVPGDIVHDASKPTEEHVLQIFDVYKKHFQHFHEQCEEEDEYYFGGYKKWLVLAFTQMGL